MNSSPEQSPKDIIFTVMKSKIFYISKKWVLYCKPEARLQVQFHTPIGDPKLKGEIQGTKSV